MNRQLTQDFSLAEFTYSQYAERHGINNTPNDYELANIINITAPKTQKIRDLLGKPMLITSGYRCYSLNRAVGGSATSDHMSGLAIDFLSPRFGTPKEIAQFLQKHVQELGINQLIYEGTWVHVGFAGVGQKPKNEILTAKFKNGKAKYSIGVAA